MALFTKCFKRLQIGVLYNKCMLFLTDANNFYILQGKRVDFRLHHQYNPNITTSHLYNRYFTLLLQKMQYIK